MNINMRNATRAQLVIIRFDDPMATKADRTAAENELLRREKRFSGKPTKITGRMAFRT